MLAALSITAVSSVVAGGMAGAAAATTETIPPPPQEESADTGTSSQNHWRGGREREVVR